MNFSAPIRREDGASAGVAIDFQNQRSFDLVIKRTQPLAQFVYRVAITAGRAVLRGIFQSFGNGFKSELFLTVSNE